MDSGSRWRTVTAVVLALTVLQLAVAAFVPGLEQFEGKGFAARLVLYPAMMLFVPVLWAVLRHRRGRTHLSLPWAAFALLMVPFLVDVTGNTLDLYDSIVWWDDANHFVNWFFLAFAAGLMLEYAAVRPRWALAVLVGGIGALLAIGWEIGEYFAFIRAGTELDGAYTDTLGDEVLGSLGALLAGVVIARRTGGAVSAAAPAAGSPRAG